MPQNASVFAYRCFKEVIKFNEVIRVGPNPIRLVSLEEEEIRTRDTQRRGRVRHRGKTAICKARKRPQKKPKPRRLDLGLEASGIVRKLISAAQDPQSVVLGFGGPSK